jgi:hypothetical protein
MTIAAMTGGTTAWGESDMKRIVFLVLAGMAAIALAATPADAAKRKKGKRAPAAPVVTDVNDASFRLVRDSIPMWLPTPVKIIYFAHNPEARNK